MASSPFDAATRRTYTAAMKLVGAFLLLCAALAAPIAAQSLAQSPTQRMTRTLGSMGDAKASAATLTAQLIDEMTQLAPADRRPARGTLAGFANEFVASLIGKDLTAMQRAALERAIVDMLGGAGTNYKPAGVLRQMLEAAGASGARTQRIVTGFIAIGEEVRGPDDQRIIAVPAK